MTPKAKLSCPFPVLVTIIEVEAVAPGSTLFSVGFDSERDASCTWPRFTLSRDSQPMLLPALPWM